METKTIYREFFPGYMGHIPLKNEVIGLTVGATNEHIKSFLNREPEYEQKLVPSTQNDYTLYGKRYFCENMAKDYKLEEDQVFANKSKEARTWINGSKYQIYPQHIPGYQGHIPGINGANILGMSYAKTTAVAVKGDYCNKRDLPPEERYKTVSKLYYGKPKMRSNEEGTTGDKDKSESQRGNKDGFRNDLSETFKQIINYDKQPVSELPYIVGYKGFRRGVKSGNYYGKNFREVSVTSVNNVLNK